MSGPEPSMLEVWWPLGWVVVGLVGAIAHVYLAARYDWDEPGLAGAWAIWPLVMVFLAATLPVAWAVTVAEKRGKAKRQSVAGLRETVQSRRAELAKAERELDAYLAAPQEAQHGR